MSNSVHVGITEHPEGTLISTFLGMQPYLLVEIEEADDDSVDFKLTVGGGVDALPLDELADFFEGFGEMLRSVPEDRVVITEDGTNEEDEA